MTLYTFVLGSNWLLSVAELIVCLENKGLDSSIVDYTRNIAVVESEREWTLDETIDVQSSLGGCFKIGKVFTTYPRSLIEQAFPGRSSPQQHEREIVQKCPWVDQVWHKVRNKRIRFGFSVYPILNRRTSVHLERFALGMSESIKRKLMERGAKRAAYFAYDEPDRRKPGRPNTALWPQTIAKHNLLTPPNAEIIAALTEESAYLARTAVIYDSMLQQYRDESRPYVSAEITTSPKICRTLLNLAGARRGDTVLDPFCGTGTLLIEAAMLGMNCIGIDIDGNAVQGTKSNLLWFAKDIGEYIDFDIIKGDARRAAELVQKEVDAIACEPPLGPIYTDQPEQEEAKETIQELTKLYTSVLSGLHECLVTNGRMAMTLPVINSRKGKHHIDLASMLEDTGFEHGVLLPDYAFSEGHPSDGRFRIRTNRSLLPERKQNQVVERQVIMLVRN